MKLSLSLCLGTVAGAALLGGCSTGSPNHVHVADGFFDPTRMAADFDGEAGTDNAPVIRLAAGDALGQAVFDYHHAYVLTNRRSESEAIYTRAD